MEKDNNSGGKDVSQVIQDIRDGRWSEGSDKIDLSNQHLAGQDLSGLNLSGANLSGADLSKAELEGTDLSGANLEKTCFFQANLKGAALLNARMADAEFTGANLSGANLEDADAPRIGLGMAKLTKTRCFRANLEEGTLTKANMSGADLRCANLRGARMRQTNFEAADFTAANLQESDMSLCDIKNATFKDTDMRGSRLRLLKGYKSSDWTGVDIRNVNFAGAYMMRRIIVDQNYLKEFRESSKLAKAIYFVWWLTSDCGRSLGRWCIWIGVQAVVFAVIYSLVGVDYGKHPTFLSPLYYSVITLTTLGYGDVVPNSAASQVVAMIEVVTGYIMLGGLLSILSGKMARRAD